MRIHRDQCCPFRITTDPKHPELGRFVVAARDLQPGDIIIEELPITVGPRQFVGPVCLACYRPATGQYRCRNCEWPMCSDACCQAPIHQACKFSILYFHPLSMLKMYFAIVWYNLCKLLIADDWRMFHSFWLQLQTWVFRK